MNGNRRSGRESLRVRRGPASGQRKGRWQTKERAAGHREATSPSGSRYHLYERTRWKTNGQDGHYVDDTQMTEGTTPPAPLARLATTPPSHHVTHTTAITAQWWLTPPALQTGKNSGDGRGYQAPLLFSHSSNRHAGPPLSLLCM